MNNNPIQIMIAEDDESDRMNFTEALEELKLKTAVKTVNDGVELMDYLNEEENALPYILFLDLNMPRRSGLECLISIKTSARLKELIVAIYSTSSSEKDIEETYLHGANVYIKKPNDFTTLKEILHKVVSAAYVYREPPFNVENFLFKI
jgi:CheY-like chemotaxis protein